MPVTPHTCRYPGCHDTRLLGDLYCDIHAAMREDADVDRRRTEALRMGDGGRRRVYGLGERVTNNGVTGAGGVP